MTHIMVDLETMGTRPGCMVLSIGAVEFSPSGLGPEFYQEVDYRQLYGLHVDPATLAWWHDQLPSVRDRLFVPAPHKKRLPDALIELSTWLRTISGPDGEPRVWGNGADFDNAILQVAYGHVGQEVPWRFYHNRCYRTLKSLCSGVRFERQGNHHNALADAKSQAAHAVLILSGFNLWKTLT